MAASHNFIEDEHDLVDDTDNEDFEDLDDDLTDLSLPANRKRKSALLSSVAKRKSARFRGDQTAACTSRNAASAANTPVHSKARPKCANNERLTNKIDRLCEFAHVLMHCILYKINYYNKKTHFDKFLKYNIIVYVRILKHLDYFSEIHFQSTKTRVQYVK